jgi:hypothetical protein
MRGVEIVVNSEPKGKFSEGQYEGNLTCVPGQILQADYSNLVGNEPSYKLYIPGSNGAKPIGPYFVALVANLWGRMPTVLPNPASYSSSTVSYPGTAYNPGDRIFTYCPLNGDELNLLIADGPGTGNSYTAGTQFMAQNGTGKLITATGSPASDPFTLLENLSALTADTLGWFIYG